MCSDTHNQEFSLHFAQKPWTTNSERAGNRWERALNVKTWRSAFFYLAKQQKLPQLTNVEITVEVFQEKGRLQDVGACNPACKAAIDGLVDAGVMEDDSPKFLKSIKFLQPVRATNGMTLHIKGTGTPQ
jgi:hypothetical protein